MLLSLDDKPYCPVNASAAAALWLSVMLLPQVILSVCKGQEADDPDDSGGAYAEETRIILRQLDDFSALEDIKIDTVRVLRSLMGNELLKHVTAVDSTLRSKAKRQLERAQRIIDCLLSSAN